ncbi:hypothetical protein KY317_03115 [Candidatus Woesearchaeota archaeon]|nr:hypothetical protein [Candidatus Woesearchaeota archaeon]
MAKKKNHANSLGILIMMAIFCLALVIFLKPETVTGSAVYVEYNGISNEPLVKQTGKIQTYVKLTGETIDELRYDLAQKDKEVAENILEVADFNNGLIELYEANPAARIRKEQFDEIRKGAEALADNFRINVNCIEKSALYYHDSEEMEFVIVTELIYGGCRDDYNGYNLDYDWLTASVKHTFYTIDNEIICNYKSHPLFVIHEDTGELSSNVGKC